jgi:phage-related protein/predicted  nucleic acid-binding Zn-ribbon protein
MSKGLKGITVKIDGDNKNLVKVLSNTEKETRALSGELKGINSLLKFDPKNTELLTQKQTVLKQAIEQTENKLKTLTQAQQQMAEAGKNADNSAEYRDLQREIVATQQKLTGYNSQLKNTQDAQKQAAKEAETLGQKIYKIASHIPIVNKLADGFVKAKQKITETVKESAAVQKIGSAVEGARQKVEAFKNAHPHVKKVADAFHTMKEKADELKSKLPTLQQSLAAVGNAAAGAAKGGFKALEVTIGGTMKAFAAFSTATLTAGATIAKNAIEQYSNYEQLVGGVETLYGAKAKSAQEYAEMTGSSLEFANQVYEDYSKREETVLNNARNAYKTAGMSANEYMDTVNGFAASLTSSLGQYEWQAANYADMIITDMSDNANKMGTDIESIKNAYAGFAKGNFTMLDNLKLGYGGTKSEMERLLRTAEELEGLEKGALSIDSFADIASAINTIQTEMGITGTTAKEASETIQGSISAAKSAYENLMTGLADENADLDGLIDNMTDSVLTVVDNVLPRIMETVPRIVETVPKLIEGLSAAFKGIAGQLGGLVDQLLPPLMQAFFTLIRTVTGALPTFLPQILNAAVTLFSGLLQGINETIPQIMAMLPSLIQTISSTLIANLPQLVTAGVEILVNLINGITQAIPTLISAIVELIPVIVQAIMENLPLIIDAGLNLLLSLVSGIVQAIPQLIAMLPTIIDTIVSQIVSMLPKIIETGIQLLNSLVSGIIQAIPQLIAALPQIITSTVNTITANLPKIIQTGIELLGALISGIIRAIPSLVAALPQVFSAIINAFKGINWGDLGKNIIDGVVNGIKNAASNLVNTLADLAKSALNKAKEVLGIASPSKVFRDEVGKMIPAGMAQGVEDGMDEQGRRIKAAIQKGVPTTIDGYIKSGGSGTGGGDVRTTGGGDFVQNLTINSPRELSPSETARLNRNAVRQTVLKLKPT